MPHSHAQSHGRGHHPEPCDAACRRGDRRHYHPTERHLYKGASGARTKRSFLSGYTREFERQGLSRRAAHERAERVYGATVGKVRREQMRRSRRER